MAMVRADNVPQYRNSTKNIYINSMQYKYTHVTSVYACVCVSVFKQLPDSPKRLVEWLVKALTRQVHVLAPGNIVHIGYVVVNG